MANTDTKPFGRILLTNDDGIDAPGLVVAEEVARQFSDEVWVVAPEHDQSGTSRQISIHSPLRLIERGEKRFAVSGSPSDCVAMAFGHLMVDARPDLVISGVNSGANMAMECAISGTLGAASSSLMINCPAIALSQAYLDRKNVPWDTGREWFPKVIKQVIEADFWPARFVININAPARQASEVQGIRTTYQAQSRGLDFVVEERTDRRQNSYFWLGLKHRGGDRNQGSDVSALRDGYISVTPVGLSMTDQTGLETLKTVFTSE